MRKLSAALAFCVFAPYVTLTTAQEAGQAADVLATARKAIGDKKLDTLKRFSAQGALQRNVGTFQMNADLELLIELPDKYLRTESMSAGPMSGGSTLGFNGERPIRPAGATPMAGGGMVIRMGPGGPATPGHKLSPEEQEKADRAMVRAQRVDLSRLMLGWFAMTHPSIKAEYTYVGEAESPDGKAHVIDVKAEGFSARLFVDEETHLPLMVTYQAPQPRIVTSTGPRPANERVEDVPPQTPALVDYTLFFEDWADTDGVKFPYKIRRAMAGTTIEEWNVTKVKVNPKIDPKKFASES
jgi:hypothetical protein